MPTKAPPTQLPAEKNAARLFQERAAATQEREKLSEIGTDEQRDPREVRARRALRVWVSRRRLAKRIRLRRIRLHAASALAVSGCEASDCTPRLPGGLESWVQTTMSGPLRAWHCLSIPDEDPPLEGEQPPPAPTQPEPLAPNHALAQNVARLLTSPTANGGGAPMPGVRPPIPGRGG